MTAGQEQRRAATLADVAARAGVSTATVSRTLNTNYPVAAATRERVLEAVRHLGYAANANARALARASSRTVGVIVQEIVDPFFGYILRSIEKEASAAGLLVIVAATAGDRQRETAFIDRMLEQRVDAVVLVGGASEDAAYQRRLAERAKALEAMGSELILCAHPPIPGSPGTRSITYDNEGGAFVLTEHLLSQGHERIVYLGGNTSLSTTTRRVEGYCRALRARGIEPSPELIRTGRFGREFGFAQTRAMLEEGLDFTAIFAANDTLASGVYDALSAHGLRIPEDVSVVGYDDTPLSTDLSPKLTTVRVPLEEMGRGAVRIALDSSDPFAREGPGARTLGTLLVSRGSVGSPPRGGRSRERRPEQ